MPSGPNGVPSFSKMSPYRWHFRICLMISFYKINFILWNKIWTGWSVHQYLVRQMLKCDVSIEWNKWNCKYRYSNCIHQRHKSLLLYVSNESRPRDLQPNIFSPFKKKCLMDDPFYDTLGLKNVGPCSDTIFVNRLGTLSAVVA